MSYKVDNAIIMAAGVSSRFSPLSYEKPKALIKVKNEVLIERQIKQLHQVGITNIIIIVGYQKEKFEYLVDLYHVTLIENPKYMTRNNHYSLFLARDYLKNTYICSADNYFNINPFEEYVDESYYATTYVQGLTKEWCVKVDANNYIQDITIGGNNSWIMLGHVFFSEEFSQRFTSILQSCIQDPSTSHKLWEEIYLENLDKLKMKIKKYDDDVIFEFDSLDELRTFDSSYIENTTSSILQQIVKQLNCKESDLHSFKPIKSHDENVIGFSFIKSNHLYEYHYLDQQLKEIKHD